MNREPRQWDVYDEIAFVREKYAAALKYKAAALKRVAERDAEIVRLTEEYTYLQARYDESCRTVEQLIKEGRNHPRGSSKTSLLRKVS